MLPELKLQFFPHKSTHFHTLGWGVDFILAEEEVTDVSDLLVVYDWGHLGMVNSGFPAYVIDGHSK